MPMIDIISRISAIESVITSMNHSNVRSAAVFSGVMRSASAAAAGSSASIAAGNAVVDSAKKYLGVPYVWGGETPEQGMDCSGLVQRSLADIGVTVPRVVVDQAKAGTEVGLLANAQPGDLIITKGYTHVVIYAGNGKIIHAPQAGDVVKIDDNWLKDADIATIRRVTPTGSVASSPGGSASNTADLITAAQRSFISGASS